MVKVTFLKDTEYGTKGQEIEVSDTWVKALVVNGIVEIKSNDKHNTKYTSKNLMKK